jgi:hypothetical protein
MTDKESDKELKELMGDDIFTDTELGINKNDYLDKDGHYKDYHGNGYSSDRNYLTFKKFYKKMKPAKEDFSILNHYYNLHSYYHKLRGSLNKKEYDYSFVKSPSLRYLLFDEPMPQSDDNDPYFSLLDIEIRKIMKKLIELLDTEDWELKNEIIEKISKINKTDYIFTKKEESKTFIPLLLYEKDGEFSIIPK